MADRPNILGRFWRGDCSLALSFWGFYIGLTIIVQWAFPAARPLIEGRTFDPFRIFAYVMAGFVLLSTIGIYQWVGLWRATSHTIARRRADGRHSIAGWTVRVVIVVAIANFGRLLVVTVVPSAREFYASDMSLRAELGPDLIARDDAMKLRVIAAVPAGSATERDSEASQKAFAEKLVAAVTPAELATLEKPANDDKARASACRSVIAMIRTAVALPPAQAGAVLRDILAAK